MRKIRRTPLSSIIWRRWINDCQTATKALMEHKVRDGKPPLGNLYKRKSIKKEFFFNKGPPFFGKCAFCETSIPDFQHGDVEHFRPKKGVTDENDEVIFLMDSNGEALLDDEGAKIPHPGYFWLAYDWKNLLPSCAKCNQSHTLQDRKVGKHNRFPVVGQHAQTPEEVEHEKPLLIDPASEDHEDDPHHHLAIDTKTGVMLPRSERGSMCVEVFALNQRDQLLAERKRACDQVWYLLSRLLRPGGDADATQELLDIQEGKRSFSMAQIAVLKEARRGLTPILEK